MIEVRETKIFSSWFVDLSDPMAKAHIIRRIERAGAGNFGDVAPVGEGVSEMRIHYGPGYRLYFVQRGREIVILLCGGDKKSQKRDIPDAKEIVKEV